MIGLATVHLTARWNGGWQNGGWWRRWDRWHGRNRPSRDRRVCTRRQRWNVSLDRCASLQQFDSANHQQNYRPGAVKVQRMQVLKQEQGADGQKHRRTHESAVAAARALAARTSFRTEQSPVAGEQPTADSNQNQRPEAVDAIFHQAQSMQKKEHAQQNEHDRTHRDLAGLDFRPAAKSCCEAEGVRYGLCHLDCLGRAHRINNLVDVKKGNAKAADDAQSFAVSVVAGTGPGNE